MLAWRGIQELQEHSAAILFDTNELMAIANVRSFRCILSKNGLQGLAINRNIREAVAPLVSIFCNSPA
jgi:hypothetical protein